jgi:hypothetical protein
MDELENKVDADIEAIINGIDIDAIVDNPIAELQIVAKTILDLMLEDYAPESIKLGIDFAQEIKKHKKIMVQDSNDPNLNKDTSDDNG